MWVHSIHNIGVLPDAQLVESEGAEPRMQQADGIYTWVSDCMGVGAPSPFVVEGSAA